jgi:phosphoribosylaminoimidazole-succinocarboxamide synthase
MLKLYEGKTKVVYLYDDDSLVIKFKDMLSAFNGARRDELHGKGLINARVSARLFEVLHSHGISNHYIRMFDDSSILARRLNVIPLEVVCRNIAAGGLLKRMPLIKHGYRLSKPIVELHLKSDELSDPLVLDDDVVEAGILTLNQLGRIKEVTLNVNDVLSKYLSSCRLALVDFKLEFGFNGRGEMMVCDELSPDTMRLWDLDTFKPLDKDVYRRGGSLADVYNVYVEAYRRIVGGEPR